MSQSRHILIVCLAAAMALAAAPVSGPSPAVPKVLDLFPAAANRRAVRRREKQPIDRVQFQLTEAEVNEYAQYALHVTPRPGLESLTVKIFPQNYYSTYTVIDFDAVERWKPGTIPAAAQAGTERQEIHLGGLSRAKPTPDW